MMRAYIYIGGEIDPAGITEVPEKDDLTIAADSGWHNAKALGVTPKILVGDFDSVGTLPEAEEVFALPPEKDRTDTQMAVDLALSRGARDLVIIGGLSGRLDHTLSNIGILSYLHQNKCHGILTDGKNRVRYIKNGGAILPRSNFDYFGIIALSGKVKGVTLDGCKYPLKKATLQRLCQYAVSNEIHGNCALVEVGKGEVLVVESKK